MGLRVIRNGEHSCELETSRESTSPPRWRTVPVGGQSLLEDSVAELQSGPRGRRAQCHCLPFQAEGEESSEKFLRG